jgi:hypothetical protein
MFILKKSCTLFRNILNLYNKKSNIFYNLWRCFVSWTLQRYFYQFIILKQLTMEYSESRNTANPKIKSISGDIINISNIDISLLNIGKNKSDNIRGVAISFILYIIVLSLFIIVLKLIFIKVKTIDCKNKIVRIDSFKTYHNYFMSKYSYNKKKRKDYITPTSCHFINYRKGLL